MMNKVMSLTLGSLLRYGIAFAGIVLCIFGYGDATSSALLAFGSVVMSAAILCHVRENRALLLIGFVMLYACYSVWYANYLSPILTTMYTVYRDTDSARVSLSSLLLFLSVLLVMLPAKVNLFGYGDSAFKPHKGNTLFVGILVVVLALILVYGFGRPDSIGGDRGTPTAFYEYSIILFLCGFYFAGNSKGSKIVLSTLLALYVMQNIVYGGRITALQLLLVVFFLFLTQKTKTWLFITVLLAGLAAFTIMGELRTGLVGAGLKDFAEALETSANRGFSWDTAYAAWHASVTFDLYGNLINESQKLYMLKQWLLSILFGNSVPMSQLPLVTSRFFHHNNGGFLPTYFQFYFGPSGPVLIALYVSFLMRLINNHLLRSTKLNSTHWWGPVITICCLYITVTSFRWILYYPSQITRGLILCFLFSWFLLWVDKSIGQRTQAVTKQSPLQNSSARIQELK